MMAESTGKFSDELVSLHRKIIEQMCLCAVKHDTILTCKNKLTTYLHDHNTTQGRDDVLVKLSLFTELFETNHCRAVQGISQTILEDMNFLTTVTLLGNEDFLEAFSACKCLGAAIVNYPQHIPVDYLKTLMMSIHTLTLDPMNFATRGDVNQAIYTLDTLKLVLRNQVDADVNSIKKCQCMEDVISKDQTFLPLHYRIIVDEVPSMMKIFLQWSKTVYKEQDQMNMSLNMSDFTKILMAFLEVVHELIKHATDSDTHGHAGETALPMYEKVSEFLLIGNISAVITKTLLDISNCVLDHFLDNKIEVANQIQNGNLTAIGHEVVRQIIGGWLERIEFRNVPLGFGGAIIAHHATPDDFCRGDYPLLRHLVRMWMSTALLVLHHKDNSEAVTQVNISMIVISKYIASKLDIDKDAKFSSWIFTLFCDQDDSLILSMLRTLQLYKLLQNITLGPNTNKAESKLESVDNLDILNSLNPHMIFVNFLDSVTFDPNFLLDLLMSSETCFLEYLVQYIRCILLDWKTFYTSMKMLNLENREDDNDVEEEEVEDDDKYSTDEFHVGETEDEQIYLKQIHIKSKATESNLGTNRQSLCSEDKQTESIETCVTIAPWTNRQSLCSEEQPTENIVDSNHRTLVNRTGISDSSSPNCQVSQEKVSSLGDHEQCTEQSVDEISPKCKIVSSLGDHEQCTEQSDDDVDEFSPKCKKRKLLPVHVINDKPNCSTVQSHQCLSQESGDLNLSPTKNKTLDEIMTVLIRLRFSVEKMWAKGLFPYNVAPLLRLLEQVEDKYEQ